MVLLLALLAQTITVANAGELKQTALCEGHKAPVFGLAWSADSKWLATAGIDKSARVWDAATGKETLKVEHQQQVIAVAFTPDGVQLVSAGYDRAIRIWDLKSGKQIEEQRKNPKDELQVLQIGTVFVEFSPDGGKLAYGSDGGSFTLLWDVKAKTQREFSGAANFDLFFGRPAWSADGLWLAVQVNDRKAKKSEVRVFGIKENKWTATLPGSEKCMVAGEGLAVNADGSKVASVDVLTGDIHVWDVKSGKEGAPLKGHKNDPDNSIMIAGITFSPSGALLASTSYDKTTRVWDVAGGKELVSIPNKSGGAAVAFSRDGKRLAIAELSGTVQLWGAK